MGQSAPHTCNESTAEECARPSCPGDFNHVSIMEEPGWYAPQHLLKMRSHPLLPCNWRCTFCDEINTVSQCPSRWPSHFRSWLSSAVTRIAAPKGNWFTSDLLKNCFTLPPRENSKSISKTKNKYSSYPSATYYIKGKIWLKSQLLGYLSNSCLSMSK